MPVNSAREVLRRYWDNSLPVNVLDIASKMGVVVQANPFADTSGHYTPARNGNPPLIEYNSSEYPVRQRFTIAHELGHHVLHGREMDRSAPCDFTMGGTWEEREANQFAAELLMPEDAVHVLVRVQEITTIPELADAFAVSYSAMQFRLRDLGYNA